ncbi:D-glycero-beta-D-manno-heptose 1,7-bisphosphate 7-phosphatase [Noviherbaspirillum sedimenti]|uniref:D,D-heptose 1,7-bisphosphate phosphatase n=1 Tax=Noviherbaspirillum sedimenti TaxID=2320865 RepID=A0A3A3GMD6_9BURK|nr:D-glycero-beta-D-manno-heptose 1,7-bisphosphate 7-phosphatase [Noviherbaspirillum sedimenti]RJG02140.1 D-glycero-beta-D-manno-heptose 1,7-bisphosphate 7-phosphatase [Noviherbaspirillum sedimenti]
MKLIVLDRNGVINQYAEGYIKSPEEWIPIPGALQAIARLNQADYRVVVTTNQSGIARGKLSIVALNAIHQKMHEAAQMVGADIDAVFYCPHAVEDNCDCRKPKPGMLRAIGKRYDVNLKDVPVVGDSLCDLQAAFVSGCTPYLVLTGNGEQTRDKGGLPPGTLIFPDLAAAVEHILTAAPAPAATGTP